MSVLIDIIVSSSTLLLVAMGFFLAFSVLRVYNMAHGEFVLVGSYTAAYCQINGVSYWSSLVCALVIGAGFATLIEILLLRRLSRRADLSTLLATWGLSLVMVELFRLSFGAAGLFVDSPVMGVTNFGAPLPNHSVLVVIVGLFVTTAFAVMWRYSPIGLILRATTEDMIAAQSIGIQTTHVRTVTFGVVGALAGLAGAVIAPMSAVTSSSGVSFTVLSVLVVLLGGRKISGLVIAAILISVTKTIVGRYVDITSASFSALALVIIGLSLRPHGISMKD